MKWLQISALCLAIPVTSIIFSEKARIFKENWDGQDDIRVSFQ